MPWLDWSCTVLYWTYCWWQPPMRVQRENRSRADLKKTDVRETVFGDLSLSTYLPAHPTWPESWCRHLYSDRQTGGKRGGKKEKEENLGERGINVTDQWRSTEQNRAELSGQQRWVKLQFEITFWSVTDLFWHHWDSLTSDYRILTFWEMHFLAKSQTEDSYCPHRFLCANYEARLGDH